MNRQSPLVLGLGLTLSISIAACGKDATSEAPVTATTATAAVATAPATPAAAKPAASRPETVVSQLYELAAHDQSPFFQTDHRERVDFYFDKGLADLIWNDVVTANGEAGALDFDPLYDAQDSDIKNFKIQPAVIEADKARVPVTFENFGKKVEIVFSLRQEGANWKITDIRWDQDRTLSDLLRPEAPTTTQ